MSGRSIGRTDRACAGVAPEFVEFSGGNIVSFVFSMNLNRRHMTVGQRAAIVASAQDWSKAQTVGKPKSGNTTGLATVSERSAQSGASDKTQRQADKVAKAKLATAPKKISQRNYPGNTGYCSCRGKAGPDLEPAFNQRAIRQDCRIANDAKISRQDFPLIGSNGK